MFEEELVLGVVLCRSAGENIFSGETIKTIVFPNEQMTKEEFENS